MRHHAGSCHRQQPGRLPHRLERGLGQPLERLPGEHEPLLLGATTTSGPAAAPGSREASAQAPGPPTDPRPAPRRPGGSRGSAHRRSWCPARCPCEKLAGTSARRRCRRRRRPPGRACPRRAPAPWPRWPAARARRRARSSARTVHESDGCPQSGGDPGPRPGDPPTGAPRPARPRPSPAQTRARPSLRVSDRQRRQGIDDLHRLEADRHDPGEQVEDVARVADLPGPVVGVVDDAGGLVGLDLVAVDDPLDRRARAEL